MGPERVPEDCLDEEIQKAITGKSFSRISERRDDMPPLSTLQRWRRVDTEFDDRCWSAEAQGVMIKRSAYIEQMETAIAEGGPGSAIKMQGLRDLLHENTRTAGRLVSRMSDRSHVSVDKSVQHIIVGWANGDGTVKPITNEPSAFISSAEEYREER